MSDLAKIIGIIIVIPSFIIALIILIFTSLVEGEVFEALLEALNASPVLIFILSFLGVIVLIISILSLISKTF